MQLTIQNAMSDQIVSIEIEDNAIIEDIKVLIEVETGILVAEQILMHNGKPLNIDQASVASCGIRNNDLLIVAKG